MVKGDFDALGLMRWSDISDAHLDEKIAGYLRTGHDALGRRLLDARLVVDGLRVQRERVEQALARLGRLRGPPRRRTRRAWYEGVGAFFAVHVDQNEKLGFAGIKFLCAIDGRWRCPLHWEVTTNLTGLTHSRFINNMIWRWKRVPAHIVLDGAAAWSRVKDILRFYYGPRFDDVAYVPLAEGCVAVRRFQRTSSVHSTPIERSWRDLNDVTRKYRDLFKDLEARDLFRGGRNADPLDVFCLTTVFVPVIQRDVNEHFKSMSLRKKNKDTSNPNVPGGSRRPLEGFLFDYNHGLPASAADIATVDANINHVFGATHVEPAAPWEIDPLTTAASRAQRANMIALRAPRTAEEHYLVMREATKLLR